MRSGEQFDDEELGVTYDKDYVRELRQHERLLADSYRAGYQGEPAPSDDPELHDYYDFGVSKQRKDARHERVAKIGKRFVKHLRTGHY